MEGHALISTDILARYAGDAAREVAGVRELVGSGLHRHTLHRHDGTKVTREAGRVAVELHLSLDWDASAPAVGAQVQTRVADYLARMADVRPDSVDIVVDEFRPPSQRS
ncbi:MAG: Asp23/Gls24 family envelope stress response protein [Gaiellaceae bacterium MAG52_C11]|nr:Asp23/Gls24 family envelope stress response protein [Candidatus Gaiellasilicea maunaloa]